MNKLIKLSDEHYIIVDDSEIKKGDGFIIKCTINTEFFTILFANSSKEGEISGRFKVICSTKPIEFYEGKKGEVIYHYDKIKPLSLSELEEAIYGYNYHNLAKDACIRYNMETNFVLPYTLFIEGFKAHKELTKEKLFTEKDLRVAISLAWNYAQKHENNLTDCGDLIIKSLLPKTQWDCEFKDGKLVVL